MSTLLLLSSTLLLVSIMQTCVSASPISRIAIVGGGSAGLGLAVALKRLDSRVDEIYVYESSNDVTTTRVGGGVQLSGGAKVCELIGILPEIQKSAEVFRRVVGRNAKKEPLLDINLDEAIRNDNEQGLLSEDGKSVLLYSIMRSSLQEILLKSAQSGKSSTRVVIQSNKNVNAVAKEGQDTYSIKFADGSSAAGFDMVFGCDGVGSTVRQAVLRDAGYAEDVSPRYNGIRVGFAVTKVDKDFKLRPDGRGAFHQWFGDGAYALAASYGSLQGPQHMMALVYRDSSDAALGENPAWAELGLKDKFAERIRRSGLAGVEELGGLLGAADRCIDIGVRDAIVPLPTWSTKDGRVVLMGDSAHAMAPFLGQGANQALQDAYVLAKGIKDLNSRTVPSAGIGASVQQ
jgi:2-polyprenyl-6-methoxyphenol hydroxylase-like FAD-dependent oxidoreductase